MSENSFLKETPIQYIILLNFLPFLSFILFFFFSSLFFFFWTLYLFHKHPWSCRNDCNIFKIIKFIKRKLKMLLITNSIAIAQCMSTVPLRWLYVINWGLDRTLWEWTKREGCEPRFYVVASALFFYIIKKMIIIINKVLKHVDMFHFHFSIGYYYWNMILLFSKICTQMIPLV